MSNTAPNLEAGDGDERDGDEEESEEEGRQKTKNRQPFLSRYIGFNDCTAKWLPKLWIMARNLAFNLRSGL